MASAGHRASFLQRGIRATDAITESELRCKEPSQAMS